MAISAKFEADFRSFNDAVQGAEAKLRSFDDNSSKVTASLARMGNSFSGTKIISDATVMTKAISDAGGASTLTAREMAGVNTALNEAIEKYKALGGVAPKAMQDLADATKHVEPPITTMIGRLNAAKDSLTAFASGAKTVGMGLTAAVTAPLAAIGIAAFKASTDFETAFSGVKKTVSGTPEELGKINTEFREMAKTTPVSAVGLAKIGEMAGQLGVSKDKISAFTKTIADISVATSLTADEAGSSFARLANVLKLPQDQFSNLGSAVVALGNFGASTEQEMLSMAQRISAAGSTAGMTAPQVLGIANALSSVGIEAEAGGTAVSKVIIQMASSVASGGGKLAEFAKVAGMSAADFRKAWRDDAGSAFSSFMQGLAKVRESGGDQLIGLMDELGFHEVRLRNAFLSAANSGDLMRDSIALGSKAFAENTELARASEERYKTVANQLKVFWNQITDVAITLGDALIPTLMDLVKAGQPVVGWLSDAAKWFKELPQWVREAAVGMAAFAAAVGPTVFVMGSLAGAVNSLLPLLTALSAGGAASGMAAVVGFLANPLVLAGAVVIGGIALAVYELHKSLDQLSRIPSVGKPLEGLKDANGHLLLTAETAWKAAKEVGGLSDATGDLTDGFKLTIGSLKTAKTATDAHIASTIRSAAEIKAEAKELNEVAKAHEIVRLAAIPLTVAQQDHVRALMALNTAAGETIISTKTMAKEIGASETQVRVFEGSLKLATLATQKIYNVFGTLATTIPNLTGATHDFSEKVDLATTGVIELNAGMEGLPKSVQGGKVAIDDVTRAAKTMGEEITGNLTAALDSIPGTLVNAFTGGGGIMGALKAIGVQIAEAIAKPLLSALTKGIVTALNSITSSATSSGTAITGAMNGGTAATLAFTGVGIYAAYLMNKSASEASNMAAQMDELSTVVLSFATAEEKSAAHGDQLALSMSVIQDAFVATGHTAQEAGEVFRAVLLARTEGPEAMAAAIANLMGPLREWHANLEAIAAAQEVVAGKINDFAGVVADVGVGIPDFLQPMLDDLMTAPGLTDALKASIAGLRDSASPDFAKMEALAKGYGIEIDQLGPKFQQAHVTADAAKWIGDFEKLMASGADFNGVLGGMADEASKVVQESVHFGTTIPENMRPMIQSLIDTGQLLDESGTKITDISGLKFGEAVKTDVDKLADAIKELSLAIAGIPKKIGDVNNTKITPVHVPIVYDDPGFRAPTVPGEIVPGAATGGFVTPSGIQHFALGGSVLNFKSRGSDTVPAMLTPGEMVLTPAQQQRLKGGSPDAVDIRPHLDRIERRLADLPDAMGRSVKNEVQKIGGRRR